MIPFILIIIDDDSDDHGDEHDHLIGFDYDQRLKPQDCEAVQRCTKKIVNEHDTMVAFMGEAAEDYSGVSALFFTPVNHCFWSWEEAKRYCGKSAGQHWAMLGHFG